MSDFIIFAITKCASITIIAYFISVFRVCECLCMHSIYVGDKKREGIGFVVDKDANIINLLFILTNTV